MKLIVDMQGAQTASRHRGIGRYSLSLMKELIALAPDHGVDIHVLLNHGLRESIPSLLSEIRQVLPLEKIHVWRPLPLISRADPANIWRAEVSEVIREDFIRRLEPDAVHITSLFEGATDEACVAVSTDSRDYLVSATSYDLIPLKDPSRYLPDGLIRKWYELKLKSLMRADALFAISESSRMEVIEFLGYDANSVINVSSDTSDNFRVIKHSSRFDETLSRFGINQRYIMYNGVISVNDPRKNVANLLKGYALSRKRNTSQSFQLVLSGGVSPEDTNHLRAIADAAGLRPHDVVFTGYISDRELVVLHNASSLHVLPSLHEGFGLPILEAMRCGAPAIASNCSSMPEVVGRQDALFDPSSIDSIADCIVRFMADEEERLNLVEHAAKQQAEFSWSITASAILRHLAQLKSKKQSAKAASGRVPQLGVPQLIKKNVKESEFSDSDLLNLAESISWNISISRKSRIYIDITELAAYKKSTGIQRVVKSIVEDFMSTERENFEILPVVRSEGRYAYATDFVKETCQGSLEVEKHGTVAFGARDVFLGLDLDLQVDVQARETLRYAKEGGTRLYFVVYDVLPCNHPEWFNSELFGFFRWHYEKISELADALFCISDTVVLEVGEVLDQLSTRIDALPLYSFRLGFEFDSKAGDLTSNSLLPCENYLLMVGTIEPRKGYFEVLLAMEEFWERGGEFSLLIIGKEGWLCEDLMELIERGKYLDSKLFWIREASDSILAEAYQKASGLIAASFNEGFGLPIVEASSFGLPLFVRDIPVFREVAGDNATYFSSESSSLCLDLEQWVLNIKNVSALPSAGVRLSSWAESADELMYLVEDCKLQPKRLWRRGERYLWLLKSIFTMEIEFPHDLLSPFAILVGEHTDDGFVSSEQGAFHIVTSPRELLKGRYEMVIKFGKSNLHQSVLMEVRAGGAPLLARTNYSEKNKQVSVLLEVEDNVVDLEIELSESASLGLCVESIEILELVNESVVSVE
ncbi:MAG: glycosyltransferase involved in cell wall biosynthesis [Candidatus Azotimanducaceae bacterium]|jgi:glycosyltransferase involved in cell wall biosynthesis